MPFTIDTDLIENDEVRLTENSSGNLEILHVPSGKSFEIDTSEKASSISNVTDHSDLSGIGSSDHHTKTTSASELTDVSPDSNSSAHHSRYADSEAISAINNDSNHGSTASHNYFSGSHNDLSNVGSSDHHSRYSDNEAVAAVENDGTLSINITGNADEVDGYDVQKNGSDSNGIINFKT